MASWASDGRQPKEHHVVAVLKVEERCSRSAPVRYDDVKEDRCEDTPRGCGRIRAHVNAQPWLEELARSVSDAR